MKQDFWKDTIEETLLTINEKKKLFLSNTLNIYEDISMMEYFSKAQTI